MSNVSQLQEAVERKERRRLVLRRRAVGRDAACKGDWPQRYGIRSAPRMLGHEAPVTCVVPSPDGRHVLYLAYEAGTLEHPRDRNVELRLMPAEGGATRTLVSLFGGQGTINVPSWSPDGRTVGMKLNLAIDPAGLEPGDVDGIRNDGHLPR